MPQVCDLSHSFLAVSEYHIFKDNMSKLPRDIHYNGSHLIIWCKFKVIFLMQDYLMHHTTINRHMTGPSFFDLLWNIMAQFRTEVEYLHIWSILEPSTII